MSVAGTADPRPAGAALLVRLSASGQAWLLREERKLRPQATTAEPRSGLASRYRLPLLVLAFVAVGLLSQGLMGPGGDSATFTHAGRMLLSRHWADTFADAEVQSGPLFLLLHGIGSRVTTGSGLPPWFGGGLLTALTCGLLTVAACRSVFRVYGLSPQAAAVRELGVGLVFLFSGGLWLVSIYAHPDDLIVTLLLVIAACDAASGRPSRAGALFGVAVGVKLWALVAFAVLLVRASRLAAVRAALVAGAVVAITYGPFFLFGHVNTFHWVWQVEDPAPLNLVLATGTGFTWGLRLLQAIVAGTMGLLAVRGTWRRPNAVWLVPAAAIAGRLLMDPRGLVYYYPPLLLCLLLGAWAGGPLTVLGSSLTSMTWMVLLIGVFIVATHTVGSIWVAGFCLAVIARAVRRRQQPAPA